jgi:hypothetical protein
MQSSGLYMQQKINPGRIPRRRRSGSYLNNQMRREREREREREKEKERERES